jgi:large subunit ribosomal protein L32
MAHPKRKHSHSRTRKKRTHQKLEVPVLNTCPQCKSKKPAFKICPVCGHYKGEKVLEIKDKSQKKKQ